MKPHDVNREGVPREWADPYAYCPALAPKRRPPAKRSHRERLRDRTRQLQRLLKHGAP